MEDLGFRQRGVSLSVDRLPMRASAEMAHVGMAGVSISQMPMRLLHRYAAK